MSITIPIRKKIDTLKREYSVLCRGKEPLLTIIDETEIPESVYNSNAIENSTLTLKETEKILLEMEVSRNVSVREVFEAKNLSRVMNYVQNKSGEAEIDKEIILLLHRMLIGGIDDRIAGRFRQPGEYVRVGTHIAPAPEHIEAMLESILTEYESSFPDYFLERIANFHLEFEKIHPFCDGNGRIGRALINFQLQQSGYPPIIIRDKEKQDYYKAFREFDDRGKTKGMGKILSLSLIESLHKRIAYLRGTKIITLSEYAKKSGKKAPAIFNAAKRQNVPAFRERGVWKIGASFATGNGNENSNFNFQ